MGQGSRLFRPRKVAGDGAKAMTDVTATARDCGLYCSAASNSTMADWFNRIASVELAGITAVRAAA